MVTVEVVVCARQVQVPLRTSLQNSHGDSSSGRSEVPSVIVVVANINSTPLQGASSKCYLGLGAVFKFYRKLAYRRMSKQIWHINNKGYMVPFKEKEPFTRLSVSVVSKTTYPKQESKWRPIIDLRSHFSQVTIPLCHYTQSL